MTIDQGQIEYNFEAYLVIKGRVVPGSVRRGHNVFTRPGRLWLSRLITWSGIRDVVSEPTLDDVPFTSDRVRWFGVGTGAWVETPDIDSLRSPALINGTDYLKLASVAPAYPDASRRVRTSVLFSTTFTTAELPGNPEISEAGMFVDANDTAGVYGVTSTAMPVTTSDASPAFYKVLDPPLQKMTGTHNLVVTWELRF